MKTPPKLRRYITISIGIITIVIIIAYSCLVQFALFSMIEETASYDYGLIARDFAEAYRKDPDTSLPKTKYLTAYLGSKNLPEWFKNEYGLAAFTHGQLEMGDLIDPQTNNGEEFFFIAFASNLHDGRKLYLIETFTKNDEIPGAFGNSKRAVFITIGLGIGFILLVAFALRYFFYKISTSIYSLTTWANSLTKDNLEQSNPDFRFQEINQLADLIKNAVSDLHQALNREHHFLRNASHELRTPIAVIRTNMDLLERLQEEPRKNEKTSYQRIRRAVDNMHKLTETLLWLSRKEENMPSPESIDVSQMVDELIRENQYLLSGKDVRLDLDMRSSTATLPKVALGIVLSNLIRNAFQYTNRGTIEIHITQTSVSITNMDQPLEKQDFSESVHGFGLGLILVEQICRKLNLHYENKSIGGVQKATLFFSDREPDK